jgi:hypothetical protein
MKWRKVAKRKKKENIKPTFRQEQCSSKGLWRSFSEFGERRDNRSLLKGSYKKAHRQTNRQTDKQKDSQQDRDRRQQRQAEANRQTERQTRHRDQNISTENSGTLGRYLILLIRVTQSAPVQKRRREGGKICQ